MPPPLPSSTGPCPPGIERRALRACLLILWGQDPVLEGRGGGKALDITVILIEILTNPIGIPTIPMGIPMIPIGILIIPMGIPMIRESQGVSGSLGDSQGPSLRDSQELPRTPKDS